MVRPRTFFDFSVNNDLLGRVIFELFNDTAPITCENFRALCTGEKGLSSSGNPLYYKNSIIHRSIHNFMIQGGDFTKRSGAGGESIYGNTFVDEDLSRPLDTEGLLCMANKGPNTNGSQFFITLRQCPHLNGKHVVFGKVIKGYEVIKQVAEVLVDEKDRPLTPVVISNCGELELRKPPAKRAQTLMSNSQERGTADRRQSRRSRSRSRSGSPDSDMERSRRKKPKRKRTSEDEKGENEKQINKVPVEETEEEYDARLEREENERIEAERKTELERIKRKYDSDIQNSNGIRFKGRGRMKFVDPEINKRKDYQ